MSECGGKKTVLNVTMLLLNFVKKNMNSLKFVIIYEPKKTIFVYIYIYIYI